MAASATFAFKAGVWFRRGRLDMVSPDSQATACLPSGRNSTYRLVQISATGSLQPNSLTHEWVRQIRQDCLPRIRYHDLRHARATHLLSSGVHPKVASERLGPSKVGITIELYSPVLPGLKAAAAARACKVPVSRHV